MLQFTAAHLPATIRPGARLHRAPPNNHDWIAYPRVRCARWNGAGWDVETLAISGRGSSLAYAADGTELLFFGDSEYRLPLGRRDPVTGLWQTEVVDYMGGPAFVSALRIDPQGRPAMAYGYGAAKLATRTGPQAARPRRGRALHPLPSNGLAGGSRRSRRAGFGPAQRLPGGHTRRPCASPAESSTSLDAFHGEAGASHLLTREAFAEARGRLDPGGVLAVHLIGAPGGASTAAVARTLGAVFPHLLATRSGLGEELQDLFLFASAAPLPVPRHPDLLEHGWLGNEVFDPSPGGELLTDDRNPFDLLHEPCARAHRRLSRRE